MGQERTKNEQSKDLPRWQEIRRQRLEDELKAKEQLNREISAYLWIVEFDKNVEKESDGVAPEDTNGEWDPL
jgi:hypothetical protein